MKKLLQLTLTILLMACKIYGTKKIDATIQTETSTKKELSQPQPTDAPNQPSLITQLATTLKVDTYIINVFMYISIFPYLRLLNQKKQKLSH